MSTGTLCRDCGLCCDGSLFSYAPVAAGEIDSLRRFSLPVVIRDDGAGALEQRCHALDDTACTIYADRPTACRAYQCRLYDALAADEVSLEEAAALVDEAKALVRAVDALTPARRHPGRTFTSAEQRRPLDRARRLDREGELDREARGAWHSAEKHLDRHFRARVGLKR